MKLDKKTGLVTISPIDLINLTRAVSLKVHSGETTVDMENKGMDSADFDVRLGLTIAYALIATGMSKDEVLSFYDRKTILGPKSQQLN